MNRLVVVLVLLSGCASQEVHRVRVGLPEPSPELIACREDGFKPPDPLPRLRTVEQVAHWAASAELARQRTQAELIDCAHRLHRLHQWIDDHRAG